MPAYNRKVKVPGKTAQELYDKVAVDISRFMEKTGVGKFEVGRDEIKREVTLKSSMVNATLFCRDGALELDGSLSFLALPFKSKIDEGIDRWIAKTFNV